MRPRPLRRSSTRSSVTPGAGAKALSARGTEIFSRDDTVNESEHGEGRCRRGRGRPRARRMIGDPGAFRCFGPLCGRPDEVVVILPEEVEALRLVDLSGLEQEEAARTLGISRKTLWRDLHEARAKVADALVNGKTIRIAGCGREREEGCPEDEDASTGPSPG
ncbi:DUF134 domain-containing protein [Methanoculleus formosensis]|uniref:DUF134 domain-containing protein n=1 Tax=Methanoculleus formosensis TaxID=2590886 RepID=UPI0028F707A8|nr:DUF134 domain-containing protein [Methanoculleus sp. Afa-1]